MSHAFIREGDELSLAEIPPTVPALINFLTHENNGVRVYEKHVQTENSKRVHVMSNGLSYTKDEHGRWTILEA
ncbi:MAG: hypothetical protein KF775_01955 [Cyclobacteriaceae bacterium]|nr:hypothetical protein [Cytophagales bacterium]MBX2898381.1 hypothetical protein [Cyclobacteriaceae bacterium]